MPVTQPLGEDVRLEIARRVALGQSFRFISKELNVSEGAVGKFKNYSLRGPAAVTDKKVGEFNLDEWLDWMEHGQTLRKKAGSSQHSASIDLGDGKTPQIICPQGDWHVCSWGTDHRLVRNAIKEITTTENAWFPLMGDMVQMSIKMRSVLEVSDNLIPPNSRPCSLSSCWTASLSASRSPSGAITVSSAKRSRAGFR